MKKRKKSDPVVSEIERALDLGQFISYNRSWDFVRELEDSKKRIDALVKNGEAERAVGLYEMFLSGCYEKAEEIDDSGGNLGMFFGQLFCAWIKARQKAGCKADETVQYVLKWMDNDDYGFCYDIEQDIAQVLNKAEFQLFMKHFQDQFENAFVPYKSESPKFIYDYPADVYTNADILKKIYIVKKDIQSYLSLCEKTVASPKDCENIAMLYKEKKHFADALAWVEQGLTLEKKREWRNQSSYRLTSMRQELLDKLGRREDAFESAWSEFKKHPSVHGYDELMKYIPKQDFKEWHEKALLEAKKTSLSTFVEICIKTKEWDILSERIISVEYDKLEQISHYITEKAAKGLAKKHCPAAAKIYGAMGMRILKKGKTKYYWYALEHFQRAGKLYKKVGHEQMWVSLVDRVRKDHSRKYSFIGDFEKIVSGRWPDSPETFEKRVRKRWVKQTSD
jgi:uncharacterized Zn finger protein